MNPSGSGKRIDPHGEVSAALTGVSCWITFVVVKDNLQLNLCLMGMEERVISDKLESELENEDTSDSHLHLACAGHSAVLSTKPCIERINSLPSRCVRLGHLHESGKVAADFSNKLENLIKKNFRFEPLSELPDDWNTWHSNAKNVLNLTRSAKDLSPEDEQFILAIDNGDWSHPLWYHFCLGPLRCPAKCRGDPNKAMQLMVQAGKLSVGRCSQTPLAYEWKGFDVFLAKMYRGRRQHDCWLDVHVQIWPDAVVKRAESGVQRIADTGANVSNDQLRYKQQIRGGKTVDFMRGDKKTLQIEGAIILNQGVQFYLNKCMKAEEVVTNYTKVLSFAPLACTDAPINA